MFLPWRVSWCVSVLGIFSRRRSAMPPQVEVKIGDRVFTPEDQQWGFTCLSQLFLFYFINFCLFVCCFFFGRAWTVSWSQVRVVVVVVIVGDPPDPGPPHPTLIPARHVTGDGARPLRWLSILVDFVFGRVRCNNIKDPFLGKNRTGRKGARQAVIFAQKCAREHNVL